ncbi:hypothetical protein [Dictyobacter kobayashii]|uniref:Uncharacterized protein n=1 Tax=Dictyobacter kobayashii TaxID=2014872 RepID=A0A402AHJ2_9CHLR|nr:hypothetical protein [Dictyobacter kobayashii]GCE18576.1 hypothetical protein KDK_23760 [Dictyobacter kobayashii]
MVVQGILINILFGQDIEIPYSMKTQSPDTSIEAERVLVELIRKASVSKRLKLVQSMTQGTFLANIHAWRENHPEANEQEAAVIFVSMSYGPQLAQYTQTALAIRKDWHLQPVCLLDVIEEMSNLLNSVGVPCYLGGSIASSLYGMQQLAQDIDLIIDIPSQGISLSSFITLISSLNPYYIFDEHVMQQAFCQHTAFSLLHLDTLIKIDVIVKNRRTFSLSQPQEIHTLMLDERHTGVRVTSVYEMILFKLHRYHQDQVSRRDGMTNDIEWNDILGMLKVQGPLLDLLFFEQEVWHLRLEDIWKLVLVDAGLRNA